MHRWTNARGLAAALLPIAIGGCAAHSAPSLTLFGAYFPAWLLCVLLGIVAAIAARIAFVITGLANVLPYQLFVCAAIGVIFALLLWLFWFGP